MNTLTEYILAALATLIILTVHEYSHGYAAYRLGDPTAKNQGRLSLNPIRHIDPIGALCMIVFHFGWAKPVPIDPRYFKNPKRGFALTALAGPFANLILAFFSAFLYLLAYASLKDVVFETDLSLAIAQNTLNFLYIFHIINVGIGLFNLIPVPPLDGSRVLNVILPARTYFKIMRYERVIYFVFLGWLLGGGILSDLLLGIPAIANNSVLSTIATCLSLSRLLGYAIGWVSGLMLDFWALIPFLNI